MPAITSDRFRVAGRGGHSRKRLVLPLAGARKAVGKTQVQIAEATGTTQSDVSRLENQNDMMLSTLRRYAEALGARIDIALEFSNGTRITVDLKR